MAFERSEYQGNLEAEGQLEVVSEEGWICIKRNPDIYKPIWISFFGVKSQTQKELREKLRFAPLPEGNCIFFFYAMVGRREQ